MAVLFPPGRHMRPDVAGAATRSLSQTKAEMSRYEDDGRRDDDRRGDGEERERERDHHEGGDGRDGGDGKVSGIALRWNEKGFGFIKPNDGGEDVFCHSSSILDGRMCVINLRYSHQRPCPSLIALIPLAGDTIRIGHLCTNPSLTRAHWAWVRVWGRACAVFFLLPSPRAALSVCHPGSRRARRSSS